MTSNIVCKAWSCHDSGGGRRVKKRGIAAKLADKEWRFQSDNESNFEPLHSGDTGSEEGQYSGHTVNDRFVVQDDAAKPSGHDRVTNKYDDRSCDTRSLGKLLRPSVSDTGIVRSSSHYVSGSGSMHALRLNGVHLNATDSVRASISDTALDARTMWLPNKECASPDSTICHLRSLRMSPDTSVRHYRHLPTPPTTPRDTTKGEKRYRDPNSSSEEPDHEQSLTKSKRQPIIDIDRDSEDITDDVMYVVLDKPHSPPHLTQPDETTDVHALHYWNPTDCDIFTKDKNLSLEKNSRFGYSDNDSHNNLILSQVDGLDSIAVQSTGLCESYSADIRANQLLPSSPPHHLPPLPFDVSARAERTALKSENAKTRDILLERTDSIGEYKSADSLSLSSNSGLPVIFTHQVKNKGIDLNASTQSNNSLFGADELGRYLPDRKLNIFVGSWNMCEIKVCPVSLDSFILPSCTKVLLDMYVIGTQENAMSKKEWEVQLQETLGLSHVLLYSASHGALHIVTFVRRDLMWFCSGVDWDCVSTRAITVVKTKGAVAMSFQFFGTSLLFVNSHLSCDSSKTKHRMADYEKIIRELKLPRISPSQGGVLSHYDCIFWCGDLNFRIDKGRSNVDVMLGHLNTLDHPNFEDLIAGDQLYKCITEGRIFQDFQEGRITFSPTYKFDIGSDKYDTSSKMRIPSYTDRVLFRSRVKNSITCVCYDAVVDIKVSDHRPVFAQFQIAVQPARDGRHQVSELKFDRAVYIEANRRRGLQQQLSQRGDKSSSVCAIM